MGLELGLGLWLWLGLGLGDNKVPINTWGAVALTRYTNNNVKCNNVIIKLQLSNNEASL